MPKILVTFALRQEGVSFERRLTQRIRSGGLTVGRLGSCHVGVSWLGMGLREMNQLEESVARFRPTIVINSGFAGAVRTLLEPGDFLLAENFTSPEVVERVKTESIFDARGVFESVQEVASPADKMQRNRMWAVLAVDMESARFAAVCSRQGVAFVTARMISERANEAIPGVFLGKGFSRAKDVSDTIGFASRMIQLRPLLANRLMRLIREL